MARQLLELEPGDPRQVDHVDMDKLNNRRSNLRLATHAENQQNRRAYRGSSSRFRGVCWNARRRRWRANAFLDGKQMQIGEFRGEREAAEAIEAVRLARMPFAMPDPALLYG